MSSALRLVCLLVLLPLAAPAQRRTAPPPDALPAGLGHPDSLRAWQPRPPSADTARLRQLVNGSLRHISTNLDSARALARAAVALAWRRGQGLGLVGGLGLLADGDYYAEDYLAAQRHLEMLLWAARRVNRPDRVGNAYMGLGLVARALDNQAGAERYFVQAQRTYAALTPPDAGGELRVLLNRAYNFLDVDSLARARPLVRQALTRLRQCPQTRGPAKYLLLLGTLQEKDQQPDSAAATFRRTARLARATHDVYPEAEALLHLAGLALHRPDYLLALRYARQARQLFQALGDPQQVEALRQQAVVLVALRRPEAPAVLRRYLAQNDSAQGQQRLEAVATAQARFDLAGQQGRIRVLEQQRRIGQLRAAQAAGRARQYALVAGSLLLLLLGGGALLGLLLRSRRRLQASEAALRQASATQQQLMHIIGHDLRGPVAMFQQITPLLRAAVAPAASADADDLVRELDSSAQQLGALVDNLFDWARLQGGQLRYAPERLRAATAVCSVGQLYEPVARRKGVALELVADEHLLVWADLDLLTTVLRNLLANAIKFAPVGGRVRLAAEATGAGVAFSVADTGGGMSAAAVAAAFGAGPVVSMPGTAGEPGTGLGLRLCQHFAGLLGAELRGEAPATGGMRFWFVLPKFVPAGA